MKMLSWTFVSILLMFAFSSCRRTYNDSKTLSSQTQLVTVEKTAWTAGMAGEVGCVCENQAESNWTLFRYHDVSDSKSVRVALSTGSLEECVKQKLVKSNCTFSF